MTLCSYILILVYLHACSGGAMTGDFKDEELVSQLANANTQFSINLYKVVARSNTNIFFSPISISAVLAIVRVGAKGNTESEIVDAFKWTAFSDKVHHAFDDYLHVLNRVQASYTLTTANKIFVHNKLKLLDEFVEKTVQHFDADAVLADFAGNADVEKKTINEWVESKTNGKIKNIISGSIDPLTRLIVISAIYFKGFWEQKFDPVDTVKEYFQISSDNKVKVDMMKQRKKFRIGRNEDLKCQVLELPYVQKDLSMFILLPFEADGLSSLEEKLNSDSLKNALSEIWKETVDITLPKFVVESHFPLKKILPSLGIVDAFDMSRANLSGITGSSDLYISQLVHKTYLEVNEEGSEAAAATAARIQTRSLPIIEPFVADHPFIFLIRDNRANVILFIGKLAKPEESQVGQRQEL